MWYLKTKDGWYVCEIRGAVFITWVMEAERQYACKFPVTTLHYWKALLENWTGKHLDPEDASLEDNEQNRNPRTA